MVVLGRVQAGTIVLENEMVLPEGAVVRVEVLGPSGSEPASGEQGSLYDRLKPLAGVAKGLPPDLAANHDHYIHGRPKR
jgi:hypothetical protein